MQNEHPPLYPLRLSRGPNCLEVIPVLGSGKPQFFAFHNGALVHPSDDQAQALGSLIRLKRPKAGLAKAWKPSLGPKGTL